ncbi:MAG: aromatic ring-hydroxylating dioxygenase subunit alpha [Actinomycetota bacterium]
MATTYPIDPARALPTAAYRSKAFEAENRAVWRTAWIFVGTADEVAEPGDFVTTVLGGQPVIVLRRQNGELAAMSNLCAHRGTLLATGHGNTKRFQCPYHAWTFADDGRLLAVPHTRRDDVDRADHGLPTYRAELWHGLVFVSMGDGPTVAERLAHLEPIVRDAGIADLHHWTGQRSEEVWECNWKLAMANAMESYHLFQVHPETLEPYTPTADAYYLLGSADGTATGGRSSSGEDYTLLSLPPNLVAVVSDGNLLWQAVQPIEWNRTRIITGGAYPHPSPEHSTGIGRLLGLAADAATSLVPDFLPEDKAICERGQAAATGDFEPGPLVPMEQVVGDFHHFLNRHLHGAPVPPVRTSAEVGIARRVDDAEAIR